MLKDIIQEITNDYKDLVIDKVPYELKNNTYYVLIDPTKPLNEQNIEEMLCYKTYNSKTFTYDVNNVELRNEVLKYLPYSSIAKNYVTDSKFDYSNICFKQNISKQSIVNHSPISSIIDYRISTKIPNPDRKKFTESELRERLKKHLRGIFNLKTLYYKIETTSGQNFVDNIIKTLSNSKDYLSTDDKLSKDELISKIIDFFNLNYFTSNNCLELNNLVKNYWIRNEQFIDALNDKIISEINFFKKNLPDTLNIVYILKNDIEKIREDFLNVSKYLFANSIKSGIILNGEFVFSGKQEIMENSRKIAFANYHTSTINNKNENTDKKLYLFTEHNFLESFNYYLFIVYMVNILVLFDNNYSNNLKSILINSDFNKDGKVILNDNNKNGYILVFSKDTNTLFENLKVKKFFCKKTDLNEPLVYDFKTREDTILSSEIKQLNTISEIFNEINREFFSGILTNKEKSISAIKNNKIKTRIKKLYREFSDYSFNSKLTNFKIKYYNDLLNQIDDLFVEYFRYLNSSEDRKYFLSDTNIINSIQLIATLYAERGIPVLKQSEIETLINKYKTRNMVDLTNKDYLFIVGNLSKVLYNLSKNNSKIRFIEDLYDSKDFPTLVDKFNKLSFKFINTIDKKYVGKFLELQNIINNFEDFGLTKLKKEDKICLMNGFLSNQNVYYTKKQEQNGEQ